MSSLSTRIAGVAMEDFIHLPKEKQDELIEQQGKENDIYFEYLQIPMDFTWSLWQYCNQNNITANDLIEAHKNFPSNHNQ